MEIAPDSLVRQAGGVISKPSVLEHMHKRKIARHALSQLLFLQMITLELDSVNAQYSLGMQTVGLCYAQPLKNGIFTACEYSLRRTLSVTPLRNLPVNKRLRNFGEFNLLQNLHLCTQKSVCATNFGSLGEIGAYFSLQLTSRTQFAKIDNKKVIAENQCEKHKKKNLAVSIFDIDS